MSRRYILDTNAVGDFVNRRRGVDRRAEAAVRRGDRIGTCPPVLGEFYFGIFYSKSMEENLRRAGRTLARVRIWPYDERASLEYGRLAAELERTGRPMQVTDIQLAAIALTRGNCTVVTTDSDLSDVPELDVENWAES